MEQPRVHTYRQGLHPRQASCAVPTGGQTRVRAAHIPGAERGGSKRGIGLVSEGPGGGGVDPAADVSPPRLPCHQAQRELWIYLLLVVVLLLSWFSP